MNALFAKGREGFLDGSIDWEADDIRAIMIDVGAYTVDLAAHKFLSSVPAGARIAVSGAFTGKTATDGVADADDVTFAAVTGATVEALIIYKHTGSDATARLIAYLDTGTGMTITPNGSDQTYTWSSGADRIFRL